jgi:hypothetical protein
MECRSPIKGGVCAEALTALARDEFQRSRTCLGTRFAMEERERPIDAPARGGRRSRQSFGPALADIIGARRVRTAVMISSGSIP